MSKKLVEMKNKYATEAIDDNSDSKMVELRAINNLKERLMHFEPQARHVINEMIIL